MQTAGDPPAPAAAPGQKSLRGWACIIPSGVLKQFQAVPSGSPSLRAIANASMTRANMPSGRRRCRNCGRELAQPAHAVTSTQNLYAPMDRKMPTATRPASADGSTLPAHSGTQVQIRAWQCTTRSCECPGACKVPMTSFVPPQISSSPLSDMSFDTCPVQVPP